MKKHTVKSVPSTAILSTCTTLAVDLAKNVFQLAAENTRGKVLYEHRLKSRDAFHTFLRRLPAPMTVLMETGPGAQGWARLLLSLGHTPRILPAQHVQTHRSGPKNDRNDVLAILRAGRDERISAVPVKSIEALTMQALHRVRRGYQRRHTALSNQMRGFLLEHGIALAQGHNAIADRLPLLLQDAEAPLPDLLRELLADLLAEWEHLGERIDVITGRLAESAGSDPKARRLLTVRGVGPITATAILAKETDPARFRNARQYAAYYGAVPNQHSTGEKVRLGKMSKRGDGYIRSLMLEGAQAVLRHVKPDSPHPDDRRLLRWLHRHGRKGAAIRLANRNLRILWVLLQSEHTYCRQGGRQERNPQTQSTHLEETAMVH
jgi:transposase